MCIYPAEYKTTTKTNRRHRAAAPPPLPACIVCYVLCIMVSVCRNGSSSHLPFDCIYLQYVVFVSTPPLLRTQHDGHTKQQHQHQQQHQQEIQLYAYHIVVFSYIASPFTRQRERTYGTLKSDNKCDRPSLCALACAFMYDANTQGIY